VIDENRVLTQSQEGISGGGAQVKKRGGRGPP